MYQRIPRAFFAACAFTLITCACGGGAATTDSAGFATNTPPSSEGTSAIEAALEAPANPASIEVTFEDSASVSGVIGAEGGSLTATSMTGTTYELSIPPEALLSDVEITMTPLASAEGDPLGEAQTEGVKLEPEGLHFLRRTTLEIRGEAIGPDFLGFTADGGGEDFHLVPADPSSGALTVVVTHFSMVGASDPQVKQLLEKYQPNAPGAYEAFLVLKHNDPDAILKALELWTNHLQRVLGNPAGRVGLESATAELFAYLIRYKDTLESEGWDPDQSMLSGIRDRNRQIVEMWLNAVDAHVNQLATSCQGGDPEAGFSIARWVIFGDIIRYEFPSESSHLPTNWAGLAANCLRFKVEWNTKVTHTDEVGSSLVEATASVILPKEVHVSAGPILAYGKVPFKEADTAELIVDEDSMDIPLPGCTLSVQPGEAAIELEIKVDAPNLGNMSVSYIEEMTAKVKIEEPVWIRCLEDPITLGIQRGDVWHSATVEYVNIPRDYDSDGYAEFELEIVRENTQFARKETKDTETRDDTTGVVTQEIKVSVNAGD